MFHVFLNRISDKKNVTDFIRNIIILLLLLFLCVLFLILIETVLSLIIINFFSKILMIYGIFITKTTSVIIHCFLVIIHSYISLKRMSYDKVVRYVKQ